MPAASQLPGGGSLMWTMPLHLHVTKKSDYDDDMVFLKYFFGKIKFEKQNQKMRKLVQVFLL